MEPTPGSTRKRLTVVVAVVAVLAAGAIIAFAGRSNDSATSSPSSNSSVDIGAAPVPNGSTPGSQQFDRALLSPGMFDCTKPGEWQPYKERPLVIEVGEPMVGEACREDLVTLPIGWCAKATCTKVPDNWDIRLRAGTPADLLLVLVTPTDAHSAGFYCFRNLTIAPVQFLPIDSTIDRACPAVTPSNSVDIPYVPPATADIPYVPPATLDIPGG